MAVHLPVGSIKPALGWGWYRGINPESTTPLVDDLATLSWLVWPPCLKADLYILHWSHQLVSACDAYEGFG